jgi:hypothetical protein
MKISLEPEFFRGQDIHQNSWNFKYFPVVMVPFLCRLIFFILSRRAMKDMAIEKISLLKSKFHNNITKFD